MKLTKKHLDAMRKVKNGADVWDHMIAKALREVQKIDPTLIDITKPMMFQGTGAEQMPYFGAILTHLGREALRYTGKKRC
jgi:hypothetical protein